MAENYSNELLEGFKMTELGPLPEEWEVAKMINIAATFKGRKPPELVELREDHCLPYLTAEYFRAGMPTQFVRTQRMGSFVAVNEDDIVLIWDGSSAGDVFTGLKGVLASTMVKILPRAEAVYKTFLYFYLKTQFELLNSKTTGSTVPHVNKELFQNLPVPLPPLPEQRAIACVLSTIQRAIEAQDRLIAAAKELKKSLMRHLFTYGPVPLSEAEKVPLKETEIGLVPEHWEVVAIGNLVTLTQYGISLRGNQNGKYPIIRMNNLVDGYIDNSHLQYVDLGTDDFEKFKLNKGDVLFNRTNSYELVGKTAIFELEGDYVFASYLVRVVPDPTRVYPWYLNYCLNCRFVQDRLRMLATRAVSQSNVNATKLRGFSVPLPPLPEQQEIAGTLSAVDKKIETEQKRKAALQSLFKTMLQLLMTGRLRVKELEGEVA